MGAGNVVAAFAYWRPQLGGEPFTLLTAMALTAMDNTPEPRYWGGREHMARALGKEPGTKAASNAIDYAVKTLRRKGAISLVARPCKGRQAEYVLNLRPSNAPDSVRSMDLTQSANGPDSVSQWTGLSQVPRRTEEDQEHQEEINPVGSPGSPAVAAGYEQASTRLAQLPDLGAAALAAVPEEITGYTARVIHAARHLEEA